MHGRGIPRDSQAVVVLRVGLDPFSRGRVELHHDSKVSVGMALMGGIFGLDAHAGMPRVLLYGLSLSRAGPHHRVFSASKKLQQPHCLRNRHMVSVLLKRIKRRGLLLAPPLARPDRAACRARQRRAHTFVLLLGRFIPQEGRCGRSFRPVRAGTAGGCRQSVRWVYPARM